MGHFPKLIPPQRHALPRAPDCGEAARLQLEIDLLKERIDALGQGLAEPEDDRNDSLLLAQVRFEMQEWLRNHDL